MVSPYRLFVYALFFVPVLIHSAAPLTHLVLAKKFLEKTPYKLEEIQKRSFLLGTLFPDIRYLGEISRENTHPLGLTLNDICQSPTPFIAGMRLHAWIDEIREQFAVQCNVYALIEEIGGAHRATLLKLVEDEILYEDNTFPLLLTGFAEEELNFGIPLETVQKWHFFLKTYLRNRPSTLLQELSEKDLPLFNVPSPIIKEWSKQLPLLAQREDLKNYVKDLFEIILNCFEF